MFLTIILIALLVSLIVGTLPRWQYMAPYDWGYGPPSIAGVLLIFLIVILLVR